MQIHANSRENDQSTKKKTNTINCHYSNFDNILHYQITPAFSTVLRYFRCRHVFHSRVFSRAITLVRSSASIYCSSQDHGETRQLSYRKEDRAMPRKVFRVLTTHPATFPKICNGLLFRSILRTRVQKLKFVALSVPEIIGGTQKELGSPCIRPLSIFSQIFNWLLFPWTL